MQCPYCGADSRVVDSRQSAETVRRRRVCNECKRRFTTYERTGSLDLKVVKRDGRVEPFDSAKLVGALGRVSRHRPAVTPEALARIARAIEAELGDSGQRSVRSGQIADLVLARLRDLDTVAYNRMAANYLDETGQLRTEHRGPTEEEVQQLGLFGGEGDGD